MNQETYSPGVAEGGGAEEDPHSTIFNASLLPMQLKFQFLGSDMYPFTMSYLTSRIPSQLFQAGISNFSINTWADIPISGFYLSCFHYPQCSYISSWLLYTVRAWRRWNGYYSFLHFHGVYRAFWKCQEVTKWVFNNNWIEEKQVRFLFICFSCLQLRNGIELQHS